MAMFLVPGTLHRKKSFSIFPSPPSRDVTYHTLPRRENLYMTSLFPPGESLVSVTPPGDGNIEKLFLRCSNGKEVTTGTFVLPL
jgi:hypothetical protein